MVPNNSYVKRTGQKWKEYLSFGFLGLGGLILLIRFLFIKGGPDSGFVEYGLIGAFFGVLWFLLQALSIRCRKCGANLGWKAMKGEWSITSENCPICHHDGTR